MFLLNFAPRTEQLGNAQSAFYCGVPLSRISFVCSPIRRNNFSSSHLELCAYESREVYRRIFRGSRPVQQRLLAVYLRTHCCEIPLEHSKKKNIYIGAWNEDMWMGWIERAAESKGGTVLLKRVGYCGGLKSSRETEGYLIRPHILRTPWTKK